MKFERLGTKIIQVRGIAFNPKDISDSPLPDYVPVLKANNIKERGIDTSNLIYIHKSKIKPEQFIKKGDLLLAASSGSKDIVGKNIFFENDFEGSFGAFCKLVRPKENIHPKFVGVFFKTPIYKRHIRRLINGALINNLKNEHVDSLLIPTLNIADQIQIANILSKAETLIEQRKQSIALLDELLKSSFLEMFGNPSSNKNNWVTLTLKQLSLRFSDGPFGSNLKTEHYSDVGVQVVRLQNIGINEFVEKDISYVKLEHYQTILKKYSCYSGDIVIATMGEPNIRACIVPKHINVAVNKADCVLFRVNPELTNSYFISHLLNQKGFLFLATSFIHGQTRARISSGQLAKISIPVPPLKLQTQFAQLVEKTEALKEQYKNSLQELENLYGSLSQQAFKGELVSKKSDAKVIALAPETKLAKPELNKQQAFLRKLMLASHIIYELCEESTFGHTKLMKLLYLSEQAGGMALQTNYKKFAAGPFDGKMLTLLDQEFVKNKWFGIEKKTFTISGKQREATVYKKTEKSLLYKKHFDNYFESEAETINRIIELFRKEKTQTAEIVATLYFAWKELVTANTMISEDSLVKGFYQFHQEKKKFTKEQILMGYNYMKENKIYPLA